MLGVAELDPWLRGHPPCFEWLNNWPPMETAWEHPLVQTMAQAHGQTTGRTIPLPSPQPMPINQDYVFNYDPNEDAWSADLATMDVSRSERFRDDNVWPFFARLRRDAPVHYCPDSFHGPYWSVTRYNDIMTVDTSHQIFSSEPSITESMFTRTSGWNGFGF